MIDLFSVKVNGEYDFLQDTLPASDGTWLCSLTATIYTRGHSYNVVSGVATRIEEVEDAKIVGAIYETIDNVCAWLNNYFYVRRQLDTSYTGDTQVYRPIRVWKDFNTFHSAMGEYTFANNEITDVEEGVFEANDLIQVREGLRNNYVSYATVSGSTVTVDNPDFRDTTESALIMLMNIPTGAQQAISSMIYYDAFTRDTPTTLQSENIGNYSYQKGDTKIGYLSYPDEYVSKLTVYKRVKFQQ